MRKAGSLLDGNHHFHLVELDFDSRYHGYVLVRRMECHESIREAKRSRTQQGLAKPLYRVTCVSSQLGTHSQKINWGMRKIYKSEVAAIKGGLIDSGETEY